MRCGNLLDDRHQRVSDHEDFHQLIHSSTGASSIGTRSGREPPSSGTPTSSRSKYLVPGSWGMGSSGTSPCSASGTHRPALAILCPRGTAWCCDSARALRAQTLVPPSHGGSSVFAMNLRPHEGTKLMATHKGNARHTEKTSVFRPCVVVVVVVVVRTCSMTHVSVDMRQRMHLIRVAGHLGVRLPATPPPRALDDEELFVIQSSWALTSKRTDCEKCRKMRQKPDSAHHPRARRQDPNHPSP